MVTESLICLWKIFRSHFDLKRVSKNLKLNIPIRYLEIFLEYITLYRSYFFDALANSEKNASELKERDDAINDYAKKGYQVINSGTCVNNAEAKDAKIIFWALMEKPDNPKQTI